MKLFEHSEYLDENGEFTYNHICELCFGPKSHDVGLIAGYVFAFAENLKYPDCTVGKENPKLANKYVLLTSSGQGHDWLISFDETPKKIKNLENEEYEVAYHINWNIKAPNFPHKAYEFIKDIKEKLGFSEEMEHEINFESFLFHKAGQLLSRLAKKKNAHANISCAENPI